jgi:hypothetical protein
MPERSTPTAITAIVHRRASGNGGGEFSNPVGLDHQIRNVGTILANIAP